MDFKTFTKLFSGSPFKPLLQHRELILDALLHLNWQVHNLNSDQSHNAQSSDWIKAFPGQLEKLEHETLQRIHQPSITSQPKDIVINTLQIQNSIAHEICRLSERLGYRSLNLPPELIVPINVLARQFG